MHHDMKMYGGVEVELHAFLALVLDDAWSTSRLRRFTLKETAPGAQGIRGWMGPRAGPDAMARKRILAPVENRSPDIQLVA
jgi:hypothetical protein